MSDGRFAIADMENRMMTRNFLIAAAALVWAHAAAAADVRTTMDPQADLGKYGTFAFLESEPKGKGAIMDPMVNRRLRTLIAQHLNKSGYKPAPPGQTGELGVHFAGHVEPKQRVLMTGRPSPYSYNWGRTELGGQESFEYREGTLVVDLVDLAKGQLLWRTRITEAFSAGYSEENWKKVDQALAEAFKKLPPRR
jgi:hypothetical protein